MSESADRQTAVWEGVGRAVLSERGKGKRRQSRGRQGGPIGANRAPLFWGVVGSGKESRGRPFVPRGATASDKVRAIGMGGGHGSWVGGQRGLEGKVGGKCGGPMDIGVGGASSLQILCEG